MVRILSDSTCDLSPELIRQYNIGIIPLYVHLGDKEYRDGVDIRPEEIFRWSDENRQTPRTAAPDIEEISTYLDKDGKDEYVIFTISSSMSSSFNNCRLTAIELGMEDRVFVIDSGNLSTGIGLLAIRAALMAREGMSGSQIASEIEKIKDKVRASFVVDTLSYLHRGGRCSGLSAFFGSALQIHPRIVVEGGSMHPEKKYRGKISRCIMNYVKDMEEDLKKACPDRVFITHSGCDRETVEAVRTYLEGLGRFDEILETRAGAVISSHCGPGTLGVLFIAG
jgi:DegV family protein with EDD domain